MFSNLSLLFFWVKWATDIPPPQKKAILKSSLIAISMNALHSGYGYKVCYLILSNFYQEASEMDLDKIAHWIMADSHA